MRAKRCGFTLVEVLVVVGILAVLWAMVMAGLGAARQSVYRSQAVVDISSLSCAISNAKSTMSARYVPSYITIKSQYDLTDPQDAYDWGQLTQFFGARFGTVSNKTASSGLPDWGTIQGSQCLVFFLGGWDGANFGSGFLPGSSPFASYAGPRTVFYDFKLTRLWVPPGATVPCYVDPFPANGCGTPFAYMTSVYGNDYGADKANPTGSCTVAGGTYTQYKTGVQAEVVGGTVSPLIDAAGKYFFPEMFQVVSAGADGRFGFGGSYVPGTKSYSTGAQGADDLSNLAASVMSAPIN